jgi:hypothetical protein
MFVSQSDLPFKKHILFVVCAFLRLMLSRSVFAIFATVFDEVTAFSLRLCMSAAMDRTCSVRFNRRKELVLAPFCKWH